MSGGLRLEIRGRLAIQPPKFTALLEAAIRAESVIKEEHEIEAKRKKTTGAFTSSYSRGSTLTPRGGFGSQRGRF